MLLFQNKHIFNTLLLVFFCTLLSRAQDYSFTNYSVQDGLAQSTVYSVCKDSRGFVWISTYGGGVSRFDGRSFYTLTEKEGLGSNQVYHIFEDSKDNIWFGSRGGITKYDGFTLRNFNTSHGLKNNLVKHILEDKEGKIWVATFGGGLSKIDDTTIYTYTTEDGLLSDFIYSMEFDSNGNLWIATKEGLCYYNGERFISIQESINSNLVVRDLFYNEKESIMFVATQNEGLYELDKSKNLHKSKHLQGVRNLSAIHYDQKQDELWVGTLSNGIYLVQNSKISHFNTDNSLLSDNVILSIMKDKDNNIWVGTFGGGVSILNKTPFYTFCKEEWINNASVRSIQQRDNGEVWFGCRSMGIISESENPLLKYFSGMSVMAMHKAKNGVLWIATDGDGVFTLDKNNKINPVKVHSDKIFCLAEDKEGKMWFGSYDNGVSYLNGDDLIVYNLENGLSYDQVLDILIDKTGTAWVGTNGGGLNIIKNNTIKVLNTANGLSSNDIWSLEEDIFGHIWIGTNGGGVLMHDGKRIHHFDTEDGLVSNNIHSILFDQANNLWLGTERGIDKVIFELSDTAGRVQYKIFGINHYGQNEGLFVLETNNNASFINEEGNIWFGLVNGVAQYNQKKDIFNKVEPTLMLTNLKLFFEDVNWSNYSDSLYRWSKLPKNLKLKYSQSHLTFYFSAVSNNYSDKIKYKVWLEGFDEGWSAPISENHVTYSNIGSGDFEFKVLACNENGVWMQNPVTFKFSINTPIWKMWSFYVGLLVMIIILVYLFIRRRERIIRKEKIMLERVVHLRTKELREEKNNVELQNIEIISQKREIEVKNSELERKSTQIYDSISYAKRLQRTILTSEDVLKRYFDNSFVFFKPKDMVSGDFYWIRDTPKYLYIAAVDCTGHGVPGALMSMVCTRLLEKAVDEAHFPDAGIMLSYLHDELTKILGTDASESYVRDGMDLAMCIMEKGENKLNYAGAHNPLLLVRDKKPIRYEADRKHIGFSYKRAEKRDFTSYEVVLQKNDMIYLFSDGYADQFGGNPEKRTKFYYQRFEDMLVNISELPVREQYTTLVHTFLDWKRDYDQIDDVLVLGIRI